jgi:tetratricopeptide (TPR) repeat protein
MLHVSRSGVAGIPALFASVGFCIAHFWPALAQSSGAFPDCPQAQAQIEEGRRWLDQKAPQRAIEGLRSAHLRCPQSHGVALALIDAYLAARSFPEAEQTALEVLRGDPGSERAQFLLAYSYFMQQRFQEAGRTLQTLLARYPNDPDAHKLMGLTLFFYKGYVMAERELLAALKARPKDTEALYFLGRIYYTQNNFRPAVKAFRRQITLDPRAYKAYDNLGLCYQALGEIDEAMAGFQKAQELAKTAAPTYDWPTANLADLLIQQHREAEALPYAEEAVRINPESARDHYLLGKALSRLKQVKPSLEQLRKAAELDPQYAEPHYLLGQLYRQEGDLAQAQREFSLFQALSEKQPQKKQ